MAKQKKLTKDELATKIRAQQKKKGKKQTPKAQLMNAKRPSLVSKLNALGGSAIPGRATPKSAKKSGKSGGSSKSAKVPKLGNKRKFGKQNFHLKAIKNTKTEAKASAEASRKRGRKARIVEGSRLGAGKGSGRKGKKVYYVYEGPKRKK